MSVPVQKDQVSVGYVQLVRQNRNFRLLWIGEIISLLGDWFNLIASATLIAMLTESGLAVGGLFAVRMLAPFLTSPVAGVVADRYNRKYILIAADVIRAVALVGFLFVRDPSHIWLLYVLTAIQLGIAGFFFPTRNAMLPDIVSERELGTANALGSTTWSTMLALGAAIGGFVSGTLGVYTAFMIDALTFALSALFITQVAYRSHTQVSSSDTSLKAAFQEYLDGLRYLAGHGDILIITLHKAAIGLLLGPAFDIVQIAISKEVFVRGEGGGISLGLMFGATGIGTGIGPLVARHFTGDKERLLRRVLIVGYIIGSLGLFTSGLLLNFGTTLVGLLIRGLGGGIIWVFSTQLLLQLVPNRVRGRVFATEFAFFTLAGAAGSALAGRALDSAMTISDVSWTIAALFLLPASLWALWLMIDKPLSKQNNFKTGE